MANGFVDNDLDKIHQAILGINIPASTNYTKYVGNITQSGTSAPTANVGVNDLGTITYTRSSSGSYRINSASNSFIAGKTFVITGGGQGYIETEWLSPSLIGIYTYAGIGASLSDSVLDETGIQILITP